MLIALDVDGVLLNYRQAYAARWERAFGVAPAVKDPEAYSLFDHLDIRHLDAEELEMFENHTIDEFWTTMPIIESALKACHRLVDAGHDLIAVTAAPACYRDQRAANLNGFPLSDIHCVGVPGGRENRLVSPKAAILADLKPDFFVDDYIDYFLGVDPNIKKVLINKPINYISGLVPLSEIDFVVSDLQDALGVLL